MPDVWWTVDIMEIEPKVYYCANWCEEGQTSIRGNFCPKCAWEDRFMVVSMGLPNAKFWKEVWYAEVFDKVGLRLA